MFYNEAEKVQLKRLEGLLMQDRYLEIYTRLKDSGMRTGFACLFYGAPGTGKTETVMQLARATGRSIFQVNMANIRDKWVGESEKNVKSIFGLYQNAVRNSSVAPILLLNEADALLGGRFTEVNRSVERMENTMQNIILEEMEKLNGILIATTNLTCNLDGAFERRFLFKVEFHAPEATVRKDIWRTMIQQLDDVTAMQLAMRYDLSGGQIENIARKCKIENILTSKSPNFEMLKTFCDEELLIKERAHIVGFRNAS
jgi:SpoVK/Ycf46/Vps4 family AAA+-type ATPase